MTTAKEVADWLNSLPQTSAVPVVVTIGRTEYVGALYTQIRAIFPGCPAYAEGERFTSQNAFYLLGELPASYRRSSKTRYRFSNARRAFFVGGWYDKDEANEYHPFGRMFQMMPDTEDVSEGYNELPMGLRW